MVYCSFGFITQTLIRLLMSYDGWANFIGVFKAWRQNDIRMDEACICWTWWCKPLSCRTRRPELHPLPHTCVFAPFVRIDFTHGLTILGFVDPTWPTLQPRAFANSIAVWHKLGLIFWKFDRHSNQVAAPKVWNVGNWTHGATVLGEHSCAMVPISNISNFWSCNLVRMALGFPNYGPQLVPQCYRICKSAWL